jgi:hypothetical protein
MARNATAVSWALVCVTEPWANTLAFMGIVRAYRVTAP